MSRENRISRRQFIHRSAALTGAVIVVPDSPPAAPTATDWVPLGRLNRGRLLIPRLGMGTGSINGQVQRDLGQAGFTRLVRYAFERGVRYIDTAKNYSIHDLVREAIRGLPREQLFIQTKMPSWDGVPKDALAVIDGYRRELGVDYIDSLLIHCTTKPTWPEDLKGMMEAFDEAQRRGWIRAKGMSCHGLGALRRATESNWMEVQLARVNPQGHHVDGDNPHDPHDPHGKLEAATREIRAMHEKGRGVIGMKLVGNGDFKNPDDREKAVRYAVTCGFVDAFVMGFKSPAEIDEAIERVNRALKPRAS